MPGIPFRNDSGETVPAFALMRVTDVVARSGQPLFVVEKPNGEDGPHLVNGPTPAPSADGVNFGEAQDRVLVAGYFDDAGTPAIGDDFGPVDAEWRFSPDGTGWTFLGAVSGQVIGVFERAGGGRPVIGKPASAFSPGVLSGPDNVVNVWRLPRVSGDDPEATGGTTKATYCTGTFGTSDLVVVTPMADGSRVVSCWPGA